MRAADFAETVTLTHGSFKRYRMFMPHNATYLFKTYENQLTFEAVGVEESIRNPYFRLPAGQYEGRVSDSQNTLWY